MADPDVRAPVDPGDLAWLAGRRVGHLATADAEGNPSVVPVCFALAEVGGEPVVVSPIDEKPKGDDPFRLRRVRNILARPEVSLVADEYSEEWTRLAWTLLRGAARIAQPGEPGHEEGVAALRAKYPQYQRMALDDLPLIVVAPESTARWRGGRSEGNPPRVGETALASVLHGRRSVRAFLPDRVPREIVERAIEAAGWAPSPHGRQPWRFAVVEAPERRIALADAMAATWQAQLELDGQEAEVVQTRLRKSRERLHQAPVLVVPCLYLADLDVYPDADRQAAEEVMAIQSLGAAVQNLLLTLYASGVDGGWMCAPLFCPEVVRDALGLGAGLIPHALIAVGYAAKDPVRRPRMPLDRLIASWE